MENLTELENQVVTYLKSCDEFDEMPYADYRDVSDSTRIPITSLRGVLASLSKKKIIKIQDDFFRKKQQIIFLLIQK